MHRAFDSWAANHRSISFVDVTEECRSIHGHVSKDCELIEVWVTHRAHGEYGNEAARATPKAVVNSAGTFRHTNGRYAQRWQGGTFVPRALRWLRSLDHLWVLRPACCLLPCLPVLALTVVR